MKQNHLDSSSVSSLNIKSTNIYEGDLSKDHVRHGHGTQEWKKSYLQKYNGEFTHDNLHNKGIYSKLKPTKSYVHEGYYYANNNEGYGSVVAENGTYFEGLFKHNRRFGPGVQTGKNGQDVGLWDGLRLVRLCQVVLPEWVPKLGLTSVGKAELLNYRKLIQLPSDELDVATRILRNLARNQEFTRDSRTLYNNAVRNPRSLFFNAPDFNERYNKADELCIDVTAEEEEEEEEVFIEDDIQAQCCTPMESDLISLKNSILQKIERKKLRTKKVRVTGVLAWNNEPVFIEMLTHCFKNRNQEDILNFSVCKLLSADRDYFGDPGEYETACVAFLSACSIGNQRDMAEIAFSYNIDPDVCDARGNSGIFFACARDRSSAIGYLVEIGATLDMQNDEGLTPLSMCLLRYLALLKDVANWEEAFLCMSNMDEESDIATWCPRTSVINLVTHSLLEHVAFCNSVFFKDCNKMFMHDGTRCENTWLLKGLKLPQSAQQEFQEQYNKVNVIKSDSYVFDTSIVYVAKPPVGKAKNKNEPKLDVVVTEAPDDKLEVISTTILMLLYYGVDPNIGEVPIPIPFLGIFTRSFEIVEALLESGANFCWTLGPDSLTVLHVLASLPPHRDVPMICNLLLEYAQLDPNIRTAPEHWSKERVNIIGDYTSSVDDEGKTPLQILAMRMDFYADPEAITTQLVKMLVHYGGSTSMKYFGHTVLSLATLRGNVELVRCLLDIGCEPNEVLQQNLGNCLTIYALKRYTKLLPDLNTCKVIMDLLIEYRGNPLVPVEEFFNAIEFMKHEDVIVALNKSKKQTEPKKKKRSTQDDIKDYLQLIAKGTLFRHYQCKVLLLLLQAVIDNEINESFANNIVKFLTVEDSIEIIKLLIRKKVLQLQSLVQYVCLYLLLEFIDKSTKNVKINTVDIKLLMEDLKSNIINRKTLFELDPIEDRYIICFECLMRTNKVLIPCPKCGMAYFCSQSCNKINIKNKSRHPCVLLFYDEERKKMEKTNEIYIPEVCRHHLKYVDVNQFSTFLQTQLEKLHGSRNNFYKNVLLPFLKAHEYTFEESLLKTKTSIKKAEKQKVSSSVTDSYPTDGFTSSIKNTPRLSRVDGHNVNFKRIDNKGICTDSDVEEVFSKIKYDIVDEFSNQIKKNIVAAVNGPTNQRTKGFVATLDGPTNQRIKGFIAATNEPKNQRMKEFIGAKNEPTNQSTKGFIAALDGPKNQRTKEFISTANGPTNQRMKNPIAASNGPTNRQKKEFTTNQQKKEFTTAANGPTNQQQKEFVTAKQKRVPNITNAQNVITIKQTAKMEEDLKIIRKQEANAKVDLLMNISTKKIKPRIYDNKEESKDDIRNGTLCELVKTPTTYQKFLAKMSQYFPDLDLDGLSMPFVCYRDGQWYYKFDFNGKPVNFTTTYTSV